ncbi:hypothetical protein RFI_11735, partial [Reticulomyxa filosa]
MDQNFQTQAAQAWSGLQPIDGVSKLQQRLKEIEDYTKTLPPAPNPSLARDELKQLHTQYSQYLKEAESLRQKGLEQLRKWQKSNSQNMKSTEPMRDHERNRAEEPHQRMVSNPRGQEQLKSKPHEISSSPSTVSSSSSTTTATTTATTATPSSINIEVMKKLQNDNATLRNEMNRYDQESYELRSQINNYKNNEMKNNLTMQKLQQELTQ